MQYSSGLKRNFHHQFTLIFDVYYLFALALTSIFTWSKFSLSARVQDLWRCLLWHWMEVLSTGFSVAGQRPHSHIVECFLTLFWKNARLWAYLVSGTNKHWDSPESTLDKWSEATTSRGRSCRNTKTKIKERQQPRNSLGPYRDGWVLCQTTTITSGPCCVKSSKSRLSFSLSALTYTLGSR